MKDEPQTAHEFFEMMKKENPEKYAEVCEEYPVLSMRRIRTIRSREFPIDRLHVTESQNYGHSYENEEDR